MTMAENMSQQLLHSIKSEPDNLLDEFLNQHVFSDTDQQAPGLLEDIQYTFQPQGTALEVSPADLSALFHTPPATMDPPSDIFGAFSQDMREINLMKEVSGMGMDFSGMDPAPPFDLAGVSALGPAPLSRGLSTSLMPGRSAPQIPGVSTPQIPGVSTPLSPVPGLASQFRLYELARDELSHLKFGRSSVPLNTDIKLPAAVQRDLRAMTSLSQFNNDPRYPHRMAIRGLPLCLRVETQIKFQLVMLPPPAQFLFHLSNDLVSKPKFCLSDELPPSLKPHLLYLDVFVVTSENESCEICSRCLKREQKRAARKKLPVSLVLLQRSQSASLVLLDVESWDSTAPKRAVIFNCKQIVSFPPPTGVESTVAKTLQLSARIVCYCRHHNEDRGFRLLFLLKDNTQIVARALSDLIMIMDRKKNNAGETAVRSPSLDESSEPHTTDQAPSVARPKRKRVDESPGYTPQGSFTPPAAPLPQSALVYSGYSTPSLMVPAAPLDLPSIQRIIPAQGPIRGGIEVTLLGFNFRPGMVVKFGANQALATHCWSDTTIVTYLPPSSQPGQVLVSFEGWGSVSGGHQVFTYLDDTDRQLIELALQIVGLKMNGKLEDARNIAQRIVGVEASGTRGEAPGSFGGEATTSGGEAPGFSGSTADSSGSTADSSGSTGCASAWYHTARTSLALLESRRPTESILTQFLSLMDHPHCPVATPNFNLCTPEGQTMLHLATTRGYATLAKFLLFHGCRVDCKDKQGLTPLFYAGVAGNRLMIELLVDARAQGEGELANGKTARDYCDLNVLDMFGGAVGHGASALAKSGSCDSLASMDWSLGQQMLRLAAPTVEEWGVAGDLGAEEVFERAAGEASSDADDEDSHSDSSVSHAAAPASVPLRKTRAASLWRRVRSVFQTDPSDDSDALPDYADLFPQEPTPRQLFGSALVKVPAPAPVAECSLSLSHLSDSGDEGMVEKKQFKQDKMLLFFWLPVLLVMLSASLLHQFGVELIATARITESASRLMRSTLGSIMIGKERVSELASVGHVAA